MIISDMQMSRSILEEYHDPEYLQSTVWRFCREEPVLGIVRLSGLSDYIGEPPAVNLPLKPGLSDLLGHASLSIYAAKWHLRFVCAWRIWSKRNGYISSDLWPSKEGLPNLLGEYPQKMVITTTGEIADVSLHFHSGIVLDIFTETPLYTWIFQEGPFRVKNPSAIVYSCGELPGGIHQHRSQIIGSST